jgi:dTDP-4-amino-4,6-dideoxygalactose transaminase
VTLATRLPVPRPGTLQGPRRAWLDQLTQAPRRYLVDNARTALFQALRLLGREGARRVLLPAYHCGIEVESVLAAGYTPAFYDVNDSLRPDPAELRRLLVSDAAALVLTHFNGFPQPVLEARDLCRDLGVPLIEDCAHVLRSALPEGLLGSFGDAAVFSPRKHLPVVSGGVLAINRVAAGPAPSIAPGGPRLTARDARSLLRQWVPRPRTGLTPPEGAPPVGDAEVRDFRQSRYDLGMSAVTRRALERQDIPAAVEARRRNYARLCLRLQGLDGLRALCGPLSAGTCPMFCLVEVEDPWSLHRWLWREGVETYVFWSSFHRCFPREEHPTALRLKTHVLALPIHQQLAPEVVDAVADRVAGYFSQGGSRLQAGAAAPAAYSEPVAARATHGVQGPHESRGLGGRS